MLNRRMRIASAAALLAGATVLASSADARPRGYVYPYGGYYYRHHNGWNNGGAAAAGVIGGLALGALAAGAANNSYYNTYPTYPAYGAPAYGYGYGYGCYITHEQVYDAWGYPHWRRVRVCN